MHVSYVHEHLHEWVLFVELESNNTNMHRGGKSPGISSNPTNFAVTSKSWPEVKKGSSLFTFISLIFKEDIEKEVAPLDVEGDGFFISQVLYSFFNRLFEFMNHI